MGSDMLHFWNQSLCTQIVRLEKLSASTTVSTWIYTGTLVFPKGNAPFIYLKGSGLKMCTSCWPHSGFNFEVLLGDPDICWLNDVMISWKGWGCWPDETPIIISVVETCCQCWHGLKGAVPTPAAHAKRCQSATSLHSRLHTGDGGNRTKTLRKAVKTYAVNYLISNKIYFTLIISKNAVFLHCFNFYS